MLSTLKSQTHMSLALGLFLKDSTFSKGSDSSRHYLERWDPDQSCQRRELGNIVVLLLEGRDEVPGDQGGQPRQLLGQDPGCPRISCDME